MDDDEDPADEDGAPLVDEESTGVDNADDEGSTGVQNPNDEESTGVPEESATDPVVDDEDQDANPNREHQRSVSCAQNALGM